MKRSRHPPLLSAPTYRRAPQSAAIVRRLLYLVVSFVICYGGGVSTVVTAAAGVQPLASRQACKAVSAGRARCLATISNGSVTSPNIVLPATGGMYGPAEFHTAYQVPCTPGGPVQSVCSAPGSYGPIIAIVDAGNYYSSSGSLESALGSYDSYYGLPACTTANGCLSILNQSGSTSPLPPNISSGWSDEIALDVEVSHMMCQSCRISLIEANDDTVANLAQAELTAAGLNPAAISNSWGSTTDVPSYDADFKHAGIAVVAATGDNGTNSNGQSWPADIPEVVSAAGTNLQINTDKTWASETLWSGSGGGCSTTYAAPSWQTARSDWATQGCSNGGRAFGDLAADADPNTGAAVYIDAGWYEVGGTSLATPLIAAMFALASSLPATATASAVPYQNSGVAGAFHDISSGSDCTSTGQPNCTAGSGFDVPTGLGAPYGLQAFSGDPAPPTNLSISYVSQNQLNLSWSAATATNGVASYQIYRNGALITSTSATNYSDTGLAANTTYTYYITTTDSLSTVSAPSASVAGGTYLGPDINEDGHINLLDFSLLSSEYGQSGSSLGRADINQDGTVNLLDFSLLANKYGSE